MQEKNQTPESALPHMPDASFKLMFAGNEDVELTVGEGSDHGRFDIYIGGSLWETIYGYAASAGERVISIPSRTMDRSRCK